MVLNYTIGFRADEYTYNLWLRIQAYAKYRKLGMHQVGAEMIRDYYLKIRPVLERLSKI